MRAILMLLTLLAAPALAEERWRAVTPQDAMYNPELDMAILVRGDGSFAVVIPNPGGPGAMAGFGIPAEGYENRITSILTIGSGRVSTRDVETPELIWQGNALDGAVTYLFPISEDEVELFKAGRTWRIVLGDKTVSFPLTGSRISIDAAEAKKAARIRLLQSIIEGG
ncbi:MAG: hypothetical protein AAGM84_17845 [Pseudomonadota bacterium]